jgi:DNA-binding Xre family transcriptional regulator
MTPPAHPGTTAAYCHLDRTTKLSYRQICPPGPPPRSTRDPLFTPQHTPPRPRSETKLRSLRQARGVLQRDLAQATGLNQRTLQRLEFGEMDNPPLRYLVNCAIALDVELEEILEEEWLEWKLFHPQAPDPRQRRRGLASDLDGD